MKTPFSTTTALCIAASFLLSHGAQALTPDAELSVNADRPVPHVGMPTAALKLFFGKPAITQRSMAGSDLELWDYGTFRTFIRDGQVHRSLLW